MSTFWCKRIVWEIRSSGCSFWVPDSVWGFLLHLWGNVRSRNHFWERRRSETGTLPGIVTPTRTGPWVNAPSGVVVIVQKTLPSYCSCWKTIEFVAFIEQIYTTIKFLKISVYNKQQLRILCSIKWKVSLLVQSCGQMRISRDSLSSHTWSVHVVRSETQVENFREYPLSSPDRQRHLPFPEPTPQPL